MNNGGTVRTRRPKSITRATILQKAYDMYLEKRLDPGDERLSAVLDELGYTTGAGYQIWANQAAFRDELQVFIAENIEYASLRTIAHKIASLREANLPFEQHVLRGGDQYVEVFLGREEFYLTLRFFAMGDERAPAITESMKDTYETLTWEASELFNTSLGRFGRRLRPGVTVTDLAVAVTALVEGYALRMRVQPERVQRKVPAHGGEHHIFSVGFLGIVKELTEPIPT